MGEKLCNTFYRLASLTETRFSENEDYSRIWIYCVCFKIDVRNHRIGRGFFGSCDNTFTEYTFNSIAYKIDKVCKGVPKSIHHWQCTQRTNGIVGNTGNRADPMTMFTPFGGRLDSPKRVNLANC